MDPDAPRFDADLLISCATGLGQAQTDDHGRQLYTKSTDCTGECTQLNTRPSQVRH